MKLSAYIIRFDAGFAPNPFGRFCTLACCKPTIRRNAELGDIIVATASQRLPKPGKLIYVMRVKEIVPYQKYWQEKKFNSRKPSPKTAISRCGDNIWHQAHGDWKVAPGAGHDESARDRDTGGENALVATEFFYFGRSAIEIPPKFSKLLAKTQGHKNTRDPGLINRFWDWVSKTAPKSGRIDYPFEFTDEGRRLHCGESEADDIEET